MRKITFLGAGTSSGVPMIGCKCEVCRSEDERDMRLRSSLLVEYDGATIVIDSGMDFRYQMLRASVEKLDAILLTHEHKDHVGGLDDVRAFNYLQDKSMDIYAQERVLGVIKKDFDYAFSQLRRSGVPRITTHAIDDKPFKVGDITVVPIKGMHDQLPVRGFRIGSMAYLTDFNFIEDGETEKLEALDILIVGALRREKHRSHFTLDEALELIERVKPKRAYLTHVSHQMGLYKDIERELPEGVHLAYDTLELEILR